MRDLVLYGKECMNELDKINIPYSKKVYFTTNSRAKRRWGRCEKHRDCYEIQINSLLLDERNSLNGLKNTIIHELLHTISGCMNHGDKWQNFAEKVNHVYKYGISRCNSYEEKGICNEVIDEINRETSLKLEKQPTYIIRCEKCGHEYVRHKLTKSITNTSGYRCGVPGCNGHLVRIA